MRNYVEFQSKKMLKYTYIISFFFLSLIISNRTFAQCATSGTISSNCTTTGNMTINGTTLTVNTGIVVTVTGTLRVQAGGTLNGTGATFNVSNLADGYGTLNTINGGTYNISGNFSSGSGGSVSISNANLAFSPGGTFTFNNGNANVLNSVTITGVTSWSSNIGAGSPYGLTVTDSNITTSGAMSWHHATTSNSTFNIGGNLDIKSGQTLFDNSIINTGTGNAGTNDGTALTMNGGGVLTLTGDTQMNVRGSVTNNEWYIDDSDVIVTGDFDNAGAEVLEVRNNGTINVQGDFNNSGSGNVSADSGGLVDVDGDYNNSGGGNTDVDGGTFVVGGTYSGDDATGDAGDCGSGAGGCCGSGCGALPVTLLGFNGNFKDGNILLSWKTASEFVNDYFTIERSFDGSKYIEIEKIAGSGTSKNLRAYSFLDAVPFSNGSFVYYRLSQTDYDGTHVILDVIALNLEQSNLAEQIELYPNPVVIGNTFKVLGLPRTTTWVMYALSGRPVLSGTLELKDNIDISGLTNGTYLLKLRNGDDVLGRRVVIQ